MVALNNPYNGGTHLPDITVITPVFDADGRSIRFFVGSRGHHADIGGITPGSTPPASHTLEEEGVVIDDFLLVAAGEFREAEFRALLGGARYPARSPDVNVADIKAQVAANERGVQELARVVDRYGWDTVAAYMRHVMDNAEASVRRVLERLPSGTFAYTMDDGSPLRVAITVDAASRSATVDFTGTGPQRGDNFNAPPAVTRAAVLYAFRCLVGTDIPLNDGCLVPLNIVIPAGHLPVPRAGRCRRGRQYRGQPGRLQHAAGGAGRHGVQPGDDEQLPLRQRDHPVLRNHLRRRRRGPGFPGASAIQTHMTNTRMTDPEVLELRYPVRLEEFSIRRGSGGAGAWAGGDGALRRIRFLAPMQAVIVASRRREGPFGMAGGEPGLPGEQWVDRADGTRTALTGTDSASMAAGDVFVIATPGGGGWGTPGGP